MKTVIVYRGFQEKIFHTIKQNLLYQTNTRVQKTREFVSNIQVTALSNYIILFK